LTFLDFSHVSITRLSNATHGRTDGRGTQVAVSFGNTGLKQHPRPRPINQANIQIERERERKGRKGRGETRAELLGRKGIEPSPTGRIYIIKSCVHSSVFPDSSHSARHELTSLSAHAHGFRNSADTIVLVTAATANNR
jgi:hypothetical protein